MGYTNNLIGEKFNRLTPLKIIGKDIDGSNVWMCICDCGNKCEIPSYRIKRGIIKSCGCLLKETSAKTGKKSRTHGMSKTSFYHIWIGIYGRCNNKKNVHYKDYGARGIKLLWRSFEEFKNDMYESYLLHVKEFGKINTSLDRTDNNNGYFKENCRWATRKEQSNNTRSNVFITFKGKNKTVSEWAREFGIHPIKFHKMLNKSEDKINLIYAISQGTNPTIHTIA